MATGTMAEQIIDVVTPAAGESVTEGTILEWHAKVGDPIKLDETIVEISTDKVDVELPASGERHRHRDPRRGGRHGDGRAGDRAHRRRRRRRQRHAATARRPPGGAAACRAPPASRRSARRATSESGARRPSSAPAASRRRAGQTVDVVTPAAGESVTEGTILEWRAKVGEFIKESDTIVEISTDKVDVELPAPASGTVSELLAEEGETVTVGQVIARIAVGDEDGASPATTDDGQARSGRGRPGARTARTAAGRPRI